MSPRSFTDPIPKLPSARSHVQGDERRRRAGQVNLRTEGDRHGHCAPAAQDRAQDGFEVQGSGKRIRVRTSV